MDEVDSMDLLKAASGFKARDDRETPIAFLRTHVPWVAPEAYLHIIYKPVSRDVLVGAKLRLNMTEELFRFLEKQNGARLFSGALNIFGVHQYGQILNRDGADSLLPFSIDRENSGTRNFPKERFIAIGAYGFDGSVACLERNSGKLGLFPVDSAVPVTSWPSLVCWIEDEIRRLAVLFDGEGKCLVDELATVPPRRVLFQ